LDDATVYKVFHGEATDEERGLVFLWLLGCCRRSARRLYSSDAEDGLQDALVYLLRRIGTLQNPPRDRKEAIGRTVTVMTRQKIDNIRKKNAQKRGGGVAPASLEFLAAQGAEPIAEPIENANEGDYAAIHLALEMLGELDRKVLIFNCIEDMSLNKIAQTLGISYDAAKQRHYRAKKALREVYTQLLDDDPAIADAENADGRGRRLLRDNEGIA
jgi:RNA polymerase sigma factor (sigma-70 family)